eukprot:4774028-Alexandrium_andersonii.AAC.1
MLNEDVSDNSLKELQADSQKGKGIHAFAQLKDMAQLLKHCKLIAEADSFQNLGDVKKAAYDELRVQKDAKRDIFKAIRSIVAYMCVAFVCVGACVGAWAMCIRAQARLQSWQCMCVWVHKHACAFGLIHV